MCSSVAGNADSIVMRKLSVTAGMTSFLNCGHMRSFKVKTHQIRFRTGLCPGRRWGSSLGQLTTLHLTTSAGKGDTRCHCPPPQSLRRLDLISGSGWSESWQPWASQRRQHAHRPNAINKEQREQIHAHIRSYPAEKSRYSRSKNPNRLYLAPTLSINIMYKDYSSRSVAANVKPVSPSMYRSILLQTLTWVSDHLEETHAQDVTPLQMSVR